MRLRFITLLVSAVLAVGCDRAGPESNIRSAPRPVDVYVLKSVDPAGPLKITGSVASWKEQDIAFDVGGRVQFVQEPGRLLEGRWEDGKTVRVEGQVLAELDDRPYRIAVTMAEAAAAVAREQVGVAVAQLEKVLPANLRAAVAEQELAAAEYERYQEAAESGAVSEVDVLRAKANLDVTGAKVAQVQATFASKQAEKRSLEASAAQAREQLEDARWQLGRCQLHAPFTGEVSKVFVEAGGFAQPGQAVAHLVMMDPIMVDVAVSADTLRALRRYATVQFSVPGLSEPIAGRIYELATVADAKTRTFRVSMMVRNRRRTQASDPADLEDVQARVQRLLLPLRLDPSDPEGRWYVESRRSLHQDDQGWFVWASTIPLGPDGPSEDRPVVAVRKVRVTPGEKFVNYQGIYVLRELVDPGELTMNTILPLDLPPDFPDGGRVLLDESQWLFQPGQIISVLLAGDAPDPGLFVPMSVVLPDGNGIGRVIVVEDGRARPVRIDLGDRTGPLVRVRAVDPAEAPLVGPGAQVIRQAHFLSEGEAVRVVRTHEVRP